MHKKRRDVAQTIHQTLIPAERSQDRAAIETTECLLAALKGRQRAHVPLATGLKAITYLSDAAFKAIEARNLIILAHGELAEVASDVGLDIRAWGPTEDCPSPGLVGPTTNVIPLARSA